jgi:hypothetical protein
MMDGELEAIKQKILEASPASHYHIGLLCDYIAGLEHKIDDLETRISDMEDLREVLLALED